LDDFPKPLNNKFLFDFYMQKLNTITRFLNKELGVRVIPDNSRNGLQVRGKDNVTKIGFAVDGCMEVFEKAKKLKCDMLVVHHGILWKGGKVHDMTREKRINYLKRNKISLYGSHLPLDAHDKYGNNIVLAEMIGLTNIKKFGKYGKFKIGFKGSFAKPKTMASITNKLNKELKIKCISLKFGKSKIKTVGIVSGGGKMAVPEAIKDKLDLFITGEQHHSSYHAAKGR